MANEPPHNTGPDIAKSYHWYYEVESEEAKPAILLKAFENEAVGVPVIYCNSDKTLDLVTKTLVDKGRPTISIPSSMDAETAAQKLRAYGQDGKDGVQAVVFSHKTRSFPFRPAGAEINYDCPETSEKYVERFTPKTRFEKIFVVTYARKEEAEMLNGLRAKYGIRMEEMPEDD